jgi:polyhydroxybutyrate depolymerase
MRRFFCLVAALVLVVGSQAGADEPPAPDSQKLKSLKDKVGGGKFDPEKLKERLGKRDKGDKDGADASKLKKMTWKVGDVDREALVYLPEGTGKHPLLFAFHGHGGSAAYSARKFAFHELWPEAICVYPQGLPTAVPVIDPEGKMPGWQKFIGDQKDRDIEFFDAMLKTIKADNAVDENRIYSTGHSNGAFYTYILWAARGDTFAAFAPVAGNLSVKDFKEQKPKPVLHVAGEKDPIVRFASQERTIEQIRKLNGCSDATGKEAGKYCTEYSSSTGPVVVTFIHPGGHEVPEGAPERIVQFFKEQAKK